jgi:hypothetical protein
LNTSINNKPIATETNDRFGVFIDGFPEEGVELQLQLRTNEPLKIRLVDQSYGLPPVNATSTQQPSPISARPDMTMLMKTYSL